jgi:putative ABC transport system permease protein
MPAHVKAARRKAILRGAFRGLARYPLRSFFLSLSAVIAVAGATLTVSYAEGGRRKIAGQLDKLGTNLLAVLPQASRSVAGRARTGAPVTTLTEADAVALRREVSVLKERATFLRQSFPVKAGDLRKDSCAVMGVEPTFFELRHWTTRDGRPFSEVEGRRGERVALLGSNVARDLYGDSSPTGSRILINRVPFRVIGVLSEQGQGLDAANEDDQILVPLPTMRSRLANVDWYSGILFTVERFDQLGRAEAEVQAVMARRHRPIGKLPPDFKVESQRQLLETRLQSSESLLRLSRFVAAGVQLVSGFGVLAAFWMNVRERRHELGVRRALGATRSDIFLQVLGEAAALGIGGALLGAILSLALAPLLARLGDQRPFVDQLVLMLSVAITLLLTQVFAMLPARSASRIPPLAALQS